MSALQLSYMPMINLDFFSSAVRKIKGTFDELQHKALCQAISLVITELNISTNMAKELHDVKYLEAIKQVDFDSVYDKHDFVKEEITFLYETLENNKDKKSKELVVILDELLNECAKYEWACSDLEHMIIEDKRAS